mgnify:CR=1 FL=1
MSNKVNTVFDFIHENWRDWLRLTVYMLLPVSIVAAIGVVDLLSAYALESRVGSATSMWMMTYGVFAVGFMIANTLFLSLMRLYFKRDDGLKAVTFNVLWQDLKPLLLPMTIISFLFFVVVLPASLLSIATLLLAPFVLLIYSATVINPMLIAPAVVAFEPERSVVNCITRAFKLCYAEFWKMVGLMIVMMLLYIYSQMFVMGVWTVASVVFVSWIDVDDGVIEGQAFATVLYYVLTVIATVVQYYAYSVVIMAIAFHYGSVTQSKEDADLQSAIDDFEKL